MSKVEKIDHIGIAVKDLQKQLTFYKEILGVECTGIEELPDQKVKLAMLPVGEVRIELLQATEPDSAIARFIDKNGEGVHHIAYRVAEINSAIIHAQANKVKVLDGYPSAGAHGSQVAFLHPKSTFGVLTEFCQR